jgi:hypothetical protein
MGLARCLASAKTQSGKFALGFGLPLEPARGVWQHPCGSFNPFGIHPADPRAKYRSYFPADVHPLKKASTMNANKSSFGAGAGSRTVGKS